MQADPADFSPPLLRIQDQPPAPLAGWMLRLLLALLAGLLLWTVFGRLDIVAVADGKLVPSTYLKIVQPAEQGIVKEILVKEGEAVKEGQVLIRMDPALTGADVKAIQAAMNRLSHSTTSCSAALPANCCSASRPRACGRPGKFRR